MTAQSGKSRQGSEGTTPGKPRDGGSRQQTQPDQASQSGSPELDEQTRRRNDPAPVRSRPDNPK
jgi:hypothetical protein